MFHLNSRPMLVAALAATTLSLAACGGGTTSTGTSSSTTTAAAAASATAAASESVTPAESGEAAAPKAGAYLTQEQYKEQMADRAGTKVVYFFHAPWCPTCKATDASLTSAGVPAGLTVVKIDYDSQTDLKKKYGITQQHTFVQVGTNGEALKTWSGSTSGADIAAQTV